MGLIWRVARASDAELPDELPEDAEDAEDALPEPHPRAQLKDALWYEVTYNKVSYWLWWRVWHNGNPKYSA